MVDPAALEADCERRLGDALRTVATADFESGSYEIHYIRPDIEALYSEQDIAEIYQDLGISGFAKAIQRDLFEPLGDLQTIVYRFEHGANVVGWSESGREAVFVGLDPDVLSTDDLVDVVETAFENAD